MRVLTVLLPEYIKKSSQTSDYHSHFGWKPDTVSIYFSCPDNEGTLIVASTVTFVLVLTPKGRARFRRCLMPGPGTDTSLLVGTDDDIPICQFFTLSESVVQIQHRRGFLCKVRVSDRFPRSDSPRFDRRLLELGGDR